MKKEEGRKEEGEGREEEGRKKEGKRAWKEGKVGEERRESG